MKKILLIHVAVIFSFTSFAQEKSNNPIPKIISKQDKLLLNLNWDNWLKTSTGLDVKGFRSRGFSFLFMNEKPFGEGNCAIAWGLGFSSQNVHSNSFPTYNEDGSKTFFSPISSTTDYELNKLSCNFVDAAFEFRLRSNPNEHNKRFKIAAAIKAGYLVQSHTKFETFDIKMKTYNIKNLNKFQYGLTGRIGYGRWGFTGYYSLINLFKNEKGPELIPVSVGLSYAL